MDWSAHVESLRSEAEGGGKCCRRKLAGKREVELGEGRVYSISMHGRSRVTINPRILTMPGDEVELGGQQRASGLSCDCFLSFLVWRVTCLALSGSWEKTELYRALSASAFPSL